MRVSANKHYLINDCLFLISYSTKNGTSAKKIWDWDLEAHLSVDGVEKAILVPKHIVDRMVIVNKDYK